MIILGSVEQLYKTCGYLASFLGTLLEGEILLLTSVVSSKLGYFNFYGGLIAAFLGAFSRDSILFLITKKQGRKLLVKKPKLQKRLDDASGWYDKSPLIYLTSYRLMYGFSTVIIMLSALKENISYPKFAFHSAIGIGLWILVIGGLGYFYANIMIEKLNLLSDYCFINSWIGLLVFY